MNRILLFAGTTEGRLLWEYCLEQKIPVTACVATEYGESLLIPDSVSEVLTGRMDGSQMTRLMKERDFHLVIDATHPYAKDVTRNIKNACKESKVEYVRVLRQSSETEDIIYVDTIGKAAEFLKINSGNVLLTTGSKEVEVFTEIIDYKSRIYVRILPDVKGLAHCLNLGYLPSHIVCMQGPFTQELNVAMLKQVEAAYLITKEGGDYGGFLPKVLGAKQAGATVIAIKRPEEESGLTLKEAFAVLEREKERRL